jgi:hypothetical protein
MFSPSIRIAPSTRGSARDQLAMALISVDLPAPLAPMTAASVPGSTMSLSTATARLAP